MAKQDPQNMPVSRKNSALSINTFVSFDDTVSVKDSTIYQIQQWEYLVKKQTSRNGADELLMWLDELTGQGWELINSQPANLGFYIFKKLSN
ncbi:MAG TPA: hypothetical protein PKY82_02500 [Pyrinomonadaceae bacterium]|nr:hypothetical protein [Pyrinomonadaceae bacterium]